MMRSVLVLVLALAAALGVRAAPARAATPVTVFAAASLKNVMDEVGAAYTARTGVRVRFAYGASSALARQIGEGAPADIFISADVDWMDYAAKRGLVAAASRRDLLSNHLALIEAADAHVHLAIGKGMALARALGGGRLAVAASEVPAGKYARAALQSLGVWQSVAGRLAPAENVRGALAFVALGEAPLGIVYDTDARSEPRVKIVGLFPDWSHPRIVYPAALVAASRNAAAPGVLRFLEGPQAAAIYRRYGFTVLR
ncbi:MAG TPA: molybdate ABC transporter substrate-binding protein [Caulobacteraceae bacterium]|nr:molybdate ABC transporter substrate-binding protein [Caulobacteraceae bacterium]